MDSSNPLITPETDGRYFRRGSLDRGDYPLSPRIAARPSSPRPFSPGILVLDPSASASSSSFSIPPLPFYFLGGEARVPSYHPLSPVFPLFDFTGCGAERKRDRERERERERERFEEKRKVPGRKKGFNYSGRRNVLTRCTGNRLSSIYLPAINI